MRRLERDRVMRRSPHSFALSGFAGRGLEADYATAGCGMEWPDAVEMAAILHESDRPRLCYELTLRDEVY